MKSEAAAKHLRNELDAVLVKWKKVPKKPPERGWIHNLREALGMSTHQLARSLKMSQSGVVLLEQSEAKRTIQLSTLAKVAQGMGCELVYAMVPVVGNGTVESLLQNRLNIVADHGLHPILRKSSLSPTEKRTLIAAYAKKLKRKKIWEKLEYPEYSERPKWRLRKTKKRKIRKDMRA